MPRRRPRLRHRVADPGEQVVAALDEGLQVRPVHRPTSSETTTPSSPEERATRSGGRGTAGEYDVGETHPSHATGPRLA